jgi:F0F1-type ATP synthase membrane subunit b/b'
MINESLIIAVATVLFVGLVYKPAKAFIFNLLDEHTKEAIRSLKEAEKIYQESKEMLAQMRIAHDDAKNTAVAIIAKAKEEAEMLIAHANTEIDRITAKKTELAMARITQQELHISDYLKDAIVNEAILKAHEFISKEIDIGIQMGLVQEDLKQLAKKSIN